VHMDLRHHLVAHMEALLALERNAERLIRWGEHTAATLLGGGRLLAAGNGGSAAEAQHLVAELVGSAGTGRTALSAMCLTVDGGSLSAVADDFGWAEGLARQVRAHGRPGDILILLSTSGRSQNVLAAARAGHTCRMTVWGLTGPAPNPLERLCDDAVALPGSTAIVQELHLVAIHQLCGVVDAAVSRGPEPELPEAGDVGSASGLLEVTAE
jgi:D-sedoheptulose 7-phosphate isomerase